MEGTRPLNIITSELQWEHSSSPLLGFYQAASYAFLIVCVDCLNALHTHKHTHTESHPCSYNVPFTLKMHLLPAFTGRGQETGLFMFPSGASVGFFPSLVQLPSSSPPSFLPLPPCHPSSERHQATMATGRLWETEIRSLQTRGSRN